jgi:hypothetical protein
MLFFGAFTLAKNQKRTSSNAPNATKPLLTDRKSSLCCLHIAIYIEEKGV